MEVWESALRECVSMPVLLWLAIKDKREMKIRGAALVLAAIFLLFAGSFGTAEAGVRVGGALFGVMILVFCYFSEEAMGLADGIIILLLGISFGLYETVAICFFSSLYAGMTSAALLIFRKAGRKTRIPFLPFLLLGYVTVALLLHPV
jgi:leader peptidase (prepilin peptidase)/N-methyltransferase